jgi:hypothetical protein
MTNLAIREMPPKLSASNRRLILLAPALDKIDSRFLESTSNSDRHQNLLSRLQRFRGSMYLQDGALRPYELREDGRHCVDADYSAWHVVAVDGQGEVCGCSRYRVYSSGVHFSELAVGRSALARSVWRKDLIAAVQSERELADRKHVNFVEVGGWAISAELRRTTEALRIALATYALADYLGGCVGLTTATQRHHSAAVLKKIGGAPLRNGDKELPAYFDPEYDCEMEILKFDSAAPNPRFEPWIEQLRTQLSSVEVIAPDRARRPQLSQRTVAMPPVSASTKWRDAYPGFQRLALPGGRSR